MWFIGDKQLVKTYSEFQPLEEVIVGSPYNPNSFDESKVFDQQSKDLIKHRRESLGLTQKEFAFLLNLKDSGDRTISGWERGEHSPTDAKLKIIKNLSK